MTKEYMNNLGKKAGIKGDVNKRLFGHMSRIAPFMGKMTFGTDKQGDEFASIATKKGTYRSQSKYGHGTAIYNAMCKAYKAGVR